MSAQEPEIDIDYVANLARVALTPEEKAHFGEQLGSVLEYFQRLREVDVSGVEPSAHPFELENVWQEDVVAEGLLPEEALRNAPAARDNQIIVPKVVDDA